ncbi:hypothetical protein [Sphingomonas psychrolutea]|uniref:Uncharacterized protein n=1 Tax=Sphingomonas psychrolutea TaxID=1259676 RepID=A0ABQ1FZG9_9SPHN|nr:hypothetical protein [Sphingomonas psychrolutea]GGA34506.1 hypothetical protein GCM10011395_01040 [Sphingomonas psychrolutea]
MIAALALMAVPPSDAMDFESLVVSIAKCDRTAVTNTVVAANKRHSQFLLVSYQEQRAIAAARVELAERRRVLHAKEAKVDTEQSLTLVAESLVDRTEALADQRVLDQSEQDMLGYFRTQYLRQCSGKAL